MFFFILFKDLRLTRSNSTPLEILIVPNSGEFNPLEFEGFEITIKKKQEVQNDKNYSEG